jgi:hypothetical protein
MSRMRNIFRETGAPSLFECSREDHPSGAWPAGIPTRAATIANQTNQANSYINKCITHIRTVQPVRNVDSEQH